MKIERVDIYQLDVALSHPTHTPIGVLDACRNIAVKITADSGLYGWGEGSPFPCITGDSQASNYQTAQQLTKYILGKNPLAIEARMLEINRLTVGEPSIRSAFDMSLYDLAAKAGKMPLYQFLGGERRQLSTDCTIGLQESVGETVALAQSILDKNFKAIKMKVGRSGLQDVEHVRAVRKLVGPDVAIKIDSNQGWDYPTAVANINAMAPLNLQYSEQPLKAWDHTNLARLRNNVELPICADESVFTDKDALILIKLEAADYLNIKLGKAGGIHTGLKINALAEAADVRCMIGCFAESRLALSAAAHLAMARPNICFLDLDSAYKQVQDPVQGGMTYDDQVGGVIHLPDTYGHGALFDESFLEKQITFY